MPLLYTIWGCSMPNVAQSGRGLYQFRPESVDNGLEWAVECPNKGNDKGEEAFTVQKPVERSSLLVPWLIYSSIAALVA